MSETGLKLCQPPSPSDVPQPLSPTGQATLDLLLASGPKSSSRPSPVLRLASGPVPQPACWRVLRVCDWPQAQPSQLAHSGPSEALPIQQPAQAQLSPARPAQVPDTTQPGPAARQPATHPWLRSLVAETSFRPSPKPAQPRPQRISGHASHYRPPAHQQTQPSVPRSGLSNVSETGLRPTTSLTCLRLVSSYASCSAASPG